MSYIGIIVELSRISADSPATAEIDHLRLGPGSEQSPSPFCESHFLAVNPVNAIPCQQCRFFFLDSAKAVLNCVPIE